MTRTAGGLVALLVLALLGCKDSDGESSTDSVFDFDAPSLTIRQPTEAASFATSCDSVRLEGTASINVDWFVCCPADDFSTMDWVNRTTGESGSVDSHVEVALILATRVWSTRVGLTEGRNRVEIRLVYRDGRTASDRVSIERREDAACPP